MQSGSTDNLALKNDDGDFWDWGEIKTIVRSGSECKNIQYIEEGN